MPSPIAHSVTGYILFKRLKTSSFSSFRFRPLLLGFALFAANAADLDFIPHLLSASSFHRGVTHSIGFTLGFSFVVAALFYRFARPLVKQMFFLTAVIYSSHLLLDFFTAGGRGLQLLWPLSTRYFQAPFPLFPGVHHSEGLLYGGHVWFISYELLYTIFLIKGFDFAKFRGLLSKGSLRSGQLR